MDWKYKFSVIQIRVYDLCLLTDEKKTGEGSQLDLHIFLCMITNNFLQSSLILTIVFYWEGNTPRGGGGGVPFL